MAGGAFVDPAAISEVARALVRYGDAEQTVLAQADSALRVTTDLVHAAVKQRVQNLAAAEAALQTCQAQDDTDCSTLVLAVQRARTRLQSAQQASRMINAAAGRYAPIRTRHAANVQALVQNGRIHLGANLRDLAAYLPGGASGGGLPGGSSSGSAGAMTVSPSGLTEPAGFPTGWAMVPLAEIDTSESTVTGPESFGKGYSTDDLSWAFDKLHEVVIPALALGKTGDYFAERDQRENLMGTRSYHMTWSQFFGPDDAIRLERGPDSRLRVGNGQHRIWLAQQRGEQAVPAWIRP